MSFSNSFNEFKREIELITKQNPIECELYSIVAKIIRERDSSKNLSIKDISILKNQSETLQPTDRMFKLGNDKYGA